MTTILLSVAAFVVGFVVGAVAEARRRRIETPYLSKETRRKLRRGEFDFACWHEGDIRQSATDTAGEEWWNLGGKSLMDILDEGDSPNSEICQAWREGP